MAIMKIMLKIIIWFINRQLYETVMEMKAAKRNIIKEISENTMWQRKSSVTDESGNNVARS
jgi:hypothetical protein